MPASRPRATSRSLPWKAIAARTPTRAHDDTGLPLDTLARLTWRGNGEAARIRVRSLAYGPGWTVAFDAID
jgi:hypothetical protein